MNVSNSAKSNSTAVPLTWFTKTLRRYVPLYAELVFLAVCLRLLLLVEPFIFQVIIDRILPFQRDNSLVVVIWVFVLASIFQILFEVLSTLLGISTANRVSWEFGSRIFGHLFKLPLNHFYRWPVGETIARIRETDTIRNFLVSSTTGAFLDIIFVTIYLAVLFAISIELTFIVLASLPIQILIYFGFGPFLRQRLRAQFDAGARHQSLVVENISGVTAIKSLTCEKYALAGLENTLENNLQSVYRTSILSLISGKMVFVVKRGVTIGVILVGARLVFNGELTLGQLIAFHMLVDRVVGPITNFSKLWEAWQNVNVSRQRLGDILLRETEPFGTNPHLPETVNNRLEFKNVGFRYSMDKEIFDGFNLTIRPNSLSLIIGPSGVGKSTFGKLAVGIEVPDAGEIHVGGYDISQFDPHSVRNRIVYVPQEPYLFSGSLRQNLATGGEVTEDEMMRALEIAAAQGLRNELPGGLDAQVGERGAALSGGQRQRVALARAILKTPGILILDEPTNGLDEAAQQQFASNLAKLKESMTILVITHRPGIFKGVDQIVDLGKLDG